MENIKQAAINKQKKIITDLRENCSSETSREKAIEKLNLIVDDYEKDNSLITKDNIPLYYEFMSDGDLLNNALLLITGINEIKERFLNVARTLNLSKDDCGKYDGTTLYGFINGFPEFIQLDVSWGAFLLRYDVFGIKDTLKPIDEYIAEIKESKDYKNYINSKA